jgi:hypothetical protein
MGIKREGGLLHGLVIGVISGWRRKMMMWPDSGTHTSAREEGIGWVPIRFSSWAAGCFLLLGRRVPRVHFYFYFFFSLFLFLFSELKQIFCKTPSIDPNKKF